MRFHMRGELSNLASTGLSIVKINQFSIEVQANLLLESYRGTTDWEDGATLADAIAEIESTFQGEKGTFVAEASGAVVDEAGTPVSAIYCTMYEEEPFIVFVFTEPSSLGKGFASRLIRFAAGVFLEKGFKTIHLFVTDVNPARKLYENLGFQEIEIS